MPRQLTYSSSHHSYHLKSLTQPSQRQSGGATTSYIQRVFGVRLGSVWEVLGTCWGRVGDVLGKCWGSVGEVLGKCWGSVGEVLGKCLGKCWGVFGCVWECLRSVEALGISRAAVVRFAERLRGWALYRSSPDFRLSGREKAYLGERVLEVTFSAVTDKSFPSWHCGWHP